MKVCTQRFKRVPCGFSSLFLLSSLAAVLLLSAQALQASEEETMKAWLSLREDGDLYVIEAYSRSRESQDVRYDLQVEKAGPAGVTRSRQSGGKAIQPGEDVKLSALRLNRDERAAYRVALRVYLNGAIHEEEMTIENGTAR
jgi:hypothetical protein